MNKKLSLSLSILAFAPERRLEFFNSSIIDLKNVTSLHLDIMDGSFTKNTGFQLELLENIQKKLEYEAHLMVDNPLAYLDLLCKYEIEKIIFHWEVSDNIQNIIDKIREKARKPGIAINPETDIKSILPFLDQIDTLLVMTVIPGACGQKFIESRLETIRFLRDYIDEKQLNCLIKIDGGINEHTAKLAIEAGADSLVSGSYIVEDSTINQLNLAKLNDLLHLPNA